MYVCIINPETYIGKDTDTHFGVGSVSVFGYDTTRDGELDGHQLTDLSQLVAQQSERRRRGQLWASNPKNIFNNPCHTALSVHFKSRNLNSHMNVEKLRDVLAHTQP